MPIRSGLFAAVIAGLLGLALPPAGAAPALVPVPLVFDTDMGNDVDDALALALIHALQDEGRCELLAVTLSTPNALAGPFVDAVNTWYRRPDIPIGVNPRAPQGFSADKDFLSLALKRELYPNDFDLGRASSAVALLRRTLAAATPGSVVLVAVGPLTNLSDLLRSGPDAFSPLPGATLVSQKVRLLSLMAGNFRTPPPKRAEFNVRLDVPAALVVTQAWPTPSVWSGFEVGQVVTFPAECIDRDLAVSPAHLIREAYQRYQPTPHERPCWDLTSVWYAVQPSTDLLGVTVPGTVDMSGEGVTRHAPNADGRDRCLTITPDQADRLRWAFAAMVSRPSAKKETILQKYISPLKTHENTKL